MQLARALECYPEMGRNYQLWLYPLCNPGGYMDGTRESRSGKDLNRQFWKNSSELEVQLLEKEISKQRFNGIISLHCDDTSYGVYGFGGGSAPADQRPAPFEIVLETPHHAPMRRQDTLSCLDCTPFSLNTVS